MVRDWVLEFNAHGPDGVIDRKPPGQPLRLIGHRRQPLMQMTEAGPGPARLTPGLAWHRRTEI
jgi:hypothetical protein